MAYQTVNPYSSEAGEPFRELDDSELEAALTRAQSTFGAWREKTFGERQTIAKRAAGILRERPDEFAQLLTLEMGKLIGESRGEVALTAEIIEYYAENAEEFLAPKRLSTDPQEGDAVVLSSPSGVLLGVQPWNFPYYQLARFARPEPDGWQCRAGQARLDRPPVRPGIRASVA